MKQTMKKDAAKSEQLHTLTTQSVFGMLWVFTMIRSILACVCHAEQIANNLSHNSLFQEFNPMTTTLSRKRHSPITDTSSLPVGTRVKTKPEYTDSWQITKIESVIPVSSLGKIVYAMENGQFLSRDEFCKY